MSESRVNSNAVATVDVEDGVLNLLDEQLNHDITIGNVSLLNELPLRKIIVEGDSSIASVPHELQSHQARATAALQHSEAQLGEDDATEPGPTTQQLLDDEPESSSALRLEMPIPEPSASREMPNPLEGASATLRSSEPTLSFVPPQSICLCQAPARIPRPRNAFILFRQHHHAAIVAQNPGKPNPEISKIIGQMWKNSGDEIKSVWQSHADEEKRQHIQRYPQYRYQPRRNIKKTSLSAVTPNLNLESMTSPMETAVCTNCGGRTGALSNVQPSSTPLTRRARAKAQAADECGGVNPPLKQKDQSPDEITPGISVGGSICIDQAGVEALLQLGLHNTSDIQSNKYAKRRKLENSMSPSLSTSSLLQPSLYSTQFGTGSDPNIDPYLRHGNFDHQSPTHDVDPEGTIVNSRQMSFGIQNTTGAFSVRAMPILKKIHAIGKICPPLPAPIVPFGTPATSRMPIVIVEGDDIGAVADLYHSLFQEIKKSELVYGIDEPDDLSVLSEAYLEGLLSSTSLDKDKDTDDADASRYLSYVASWRRRSPEIRKIVTVSEVGRGPQIVLINRYILSRSDAAALRLSTDGLSPLEHWQWCATVWRSCIGADMTIYVQTYSDGVHLSDDAVQSKDDGKVLFVRKAAGSKDWSEKVIRRLSFEIGEIARSLKGFSE